MFAPGHRVGECQVWGFNLGCLTLSLVATTRSCLAMLQSTRRGPAASCLGVQRTEVASGYRWPRAPIWCNVPVTALMTALPLGPARSGTLPSISRVSEGCFHFNRLIKNSKNKTLALFKTIKVICSHRAVKGVGRFQVLSLLHTHAHTHTPGGQGGWGDGHHPPAVPELRARRA